MEIPFFDLIRHHESLSEELEEAISGVMKRGRFIAGEEVRKFEENYATYLGVDHCVTCANGTDALELVLQVCGIGMGDEVIVPAFGWISPALAVKRSGATPVFVDVSAETGNMDLNKAEKAISEKTKAIIPIHLFGDPCDIVQLKVLCQKHSILLIEDCAQSHGAEVNGLKTGSFGDLAIFSFYPTKNLGCMGDGGAIVTNRKDLADRLSALRDYGRVSRTEFRYEGRNSRLDEIQAAVLNVKLKYLDVWNLRRREIAGRYWAAMNRAIKDFPKDSVFYQFAVRVQDRARFIRELLENGIYTEVYYPFALQPVFTQDLSAFPNATLLSEQLVSLPVYQDLSDGEVALISNMLTAYFAKH